MFGYTRSGGKQFHNGIDLKNPYGAPNYAMYDGIATLHTQYKKGKVPGAGHYVKVTSQIDGKKVEILYFHMQKERRLSGTVKAVDIIRYQGDSGNLKRAIKNHQSVSHVHIKVKLDGKVVDPISYLSTKIDSKTGKVTLPCK